MTAALACGPECQSQMLPVDAQDGTTRAFDSVGRVLAQELTGLPVLAGEGQRNWIFVTGAPGFYYYGEEVAIDETWIDNAVQAYETLQRRGYEAPVLAEHNSAVTEGLRLGDVVRRMKAKVEGRWALVAEVRWAMGDAHERIEAGQIRYFSPAISAIEDDETGSILEPVISELSVVAAPHHTGSVTHVLAGETKMAETIEEAIRGMRAGMRLLRERADYVYDVLKNKEDFDVDRKMGRLKENIKDAEESVYAFADSMGITASEVTMQSTSMEKRIDKLASEIEGIAGTVQALTGLADSIKAMTASRLQEEDEEEKSEINIDVDVDEDEDEDEDKDKSEASEAELAEVTKLKYRLGQLELQRDQAVYSQDLPLGSTIELTQGVADLMFSLWRKDRAVFSKVIGDAMTKQADQPVTAPASPWATMLGEAPAAIEPRGLNDEQLHRDCLAECSGDAASASKLYYSRKYGV